MIRTLRGPGGCPWDQKQRLESLRPYLIEEAHEAAAAIDHFVEARATPEAQDAALELSSELGDLLFQLCFVAEMARAENAFDPQEIVTRVHSKMVERHPHVYSDAKLETAEEVAKAWERRKLANNPQQSILSGIPPSLPALTASYRMGQKAAGIGFDWQTTAQVRHKVNEEIQELDQAIASADPDAIEDELGDLLLSLASLARHLEIEPERALTRANRKFRRRFEHIEPRLQAADQEQAEELWNKAKNEIG